MMNKFLIGAAALAMAGGALAQGMQPPTVQSPRMDMPSQSQSIKDRVQTRAEVIAKVQKHFAMMDSNHDGAIVGDEMLAMGGKQKGARMGQHGDEMAMRVGPMGNPNAIFDRLDTNRDGMISRDEFAKGREMRIERKVVNNGGEGGEHDGMMQMHGMGGSGMAKGMGNHMLKMADANRDGRITLPEMTAAALQRFDRTDTNRDGVVTKEERKAMHQQMMQAHGRNVG